MTGASGFNGGAAGAEDDELELGLSLGVAGGCGNRGPPWGEHCRILTGKDFPSLCNRVSSRSSSGSSVSSSATLAAGGTKRAVDSVPSDVGGSNSQTNQVVVGWPPIRAFRMNTLANQSRDSITDSDSVSRKKFNHSSNNNGDNNSNKDCENKGALKIGISRFVKVNMDGDPIGRKVDLNAHCSYETLTMTLVIMFHKPTMPLGTPANGTKASKLLDGSSELALTYEDKDGDWMLVGDVPWGMFLDTVKRLRIMRTSDTNGLAPRFHLFERSSGLIRTNPALTPRQTTRS